MRWRLAQNTQTHTYLQSLLFRSLLIGETREYYANFDLVHIWTDGWLSEQTTFTLNYSSDTCGHTRAQTKYDRM